MFGVWMCVYSGYKHHCTNSSEDFRKPQRGGFQKKAPTEVSVYRKSYIYLFLNVNGYHKTHLYTILKY